MLREVVNFIIISESDVIYFSEANRPANAPAAIVRRAKQRSKIALLAKSKSQDLIKKQLKDIPNVYQMILLNPKIEKLNAKLSIMRLRKTPLKKSIIKKIRGYRDWKEVKETYYNHVTEKHYSFKRLLVIKSKEFAQTENMPFCLGSDPTVDAKIYWLYKSRLYWENDGLDAESVKALIDAKEAKKSRKIEFVKGPSKSSGKSSARYIPDDIKVAVWRRDNARCVKCGSNENLEFDHIIPVALGGSSTERNIQLLCERCNREKGADLK